MCLRVALPGLSRFNVRGSTFRLRCLLLVSFGILASLHCLCRRCFAGGSQAHPPCVPEVLGVILCGHGTHVVHFFASICGCST